MINQKQLREEVVRPVLKHLELWSESAEELLLGTAAQESGMGAYIKQLGRGPALGIFQMEPTTHDDIHKHFLARHPLVAEKVSALNLPLWGGKVDAGEMVGNFYYAAAMCRIHYFRMPSALPAANDVSGLAMYWKRFYNTASGKGTVVEFIENYRRYVKA